MILSSKLYRQRSFGYLGAVMENRLVCSLHVVMVKSIWESQPIERREMDSHWCWKREVEHPSLLHISNSKNKVKSNGGRLSPCGLQPHVCTLTHKHTYTKGTHKHT